MKKKITTKQRIINKSVDLFNQEGYGKVSLYEIAGALDMTRGNLTYHFKDKDSLLQVISDELWTKIELERNKSRQFPSFENLHNEIQLIYRIQKEYAFIFLDYHVLNHPMISNKFQELSTSSIRECEATIAFAISLGNMHPEPYEGMYHNLAFNTWMVSRFWIHQQVIRNKDLQEDCSKNIWSMLLPHLTKKGLKSFRDFFGKDYLKSLGKSFKADMAEYVDF